MRFFVVFACLVAVSLCVPSSVLSDLRNLEQDIALATESRGADKCIAAKGQCKPASHCTGQTLSGLCPGAASIKCCVTAAASPAAVASPVAGSPAAPAPDAGTPTGTTSGSGGISLTKLGEETWKVTIDGRSVTYSFCGNAWHNRPNKHTLGSCRGLKFEPEPNFSLAVADFTRAGMGPSSSKIAYGISSSEAGKKWGNLNTYDNEIVSWGGYQFSGKGGALTVVLGMLNKNASTRDIIKKLLVDNGVEIKFIDENHPSWGATLTIKKCNWQQDPGCRNGNEGTIVAKPKDTAGWTYLKDRADLMGALYLLGTYKEIAVGQVMAWWNTFAASALSTKADNGKFARQQITSEFAMSRYLYGFNGSPRTAANKFKEFSSRHPEPWNRAQLDEFAALCAGDHTYTRFDQNIGSQISHDPNSYRG